VHYLASVRNRRNRLNAVKLTYYEQIRHAVQCLQRVRQQIRQRKVQDCPENAASRKISFHVTYFLL
jgi:hypothetical protein